MTADERHLDQLARLVKETADEEIDCDQFLEIVAIFLNRVAKGLDPTAACRGLKQHVRVCPECKEELLAIAQAESVDISCLQGEI